MFLPWRDQVLAVVVFVIVFLFSCLFCHFVVVCGCVWFGFVGLFFVLKVEAPAPHQG